MPGQLAATLYAIHSGPQQLPVAVGAPTSHAIVLCVMREESGVSNRQAVKEPPAAMFSSRDVTENKTTWSFFFFPQEFGFWSGSQGERKVLIVSLMGFGITEATHFGCVCKGVAREVNGT